jgi:D-sedoheptulose 7-phosphate isomerase
VDDNSDTYIPKNYFKRISKTLESLPLNEIEFLINRIKDLETAKGTVYVIGNGGSAALANHFVTDIGVGGLKYGRAINAISLVSNISSLTATANDYGYQYAFSRELEIKSLSTKDLLIMISSSGNSLNLIEAVSIAKRRGVETFAILGFDGGKLKSIVDNYILIKSDIGEYGIVEDCHSIILHSIAEKLRL